MRSTNPRCSVRQVFFYSPAFLHWVPLSAGLRSDSPDPSVFDTERPSVRTCYRGGGVSAALPPFDVAVLSVFTHTNCVNTHSFLSCLSGCDSFYSLLMHCAVRDASAVLCVCVEVPPPTLLIGGYKPLGRGQWRIVQQNILLPPAQQLTIGAQTHHPETDTVTKPNPLRTRYTLSLQIEYFNFSYSLRFKWMLI